MFHLTKVLWVRFKPSSDQGRLINSVLNQYLWVSVYCLCFHKFCFFRPPISKHYKKKRWTLFVSWLWWYLLVVLHCALLYYFSLDLLYNSVFKGWQMVGYPASKISSSPLWQWRPYHNGSGMLFSSRVFWLHLPG